MGFLAVISAFLGMVGMVVGAMTLFEGIAEGDLKKAIIGGIGAFAGYTGMQASIAGAANSTSLAAHTAEANTLSTQADAEATITNPSVLDTSNIIQQTNIADVTGADVFSSVSTPTADYSQLATQNIANPVAQPSVLDNISKLFSGDNTAVQGIQGIQGTATEVGTKGANIASGTSKVAANQGIFDKASNWLNSDAAGNTMKGAGALAQYYGAKKQANIAEQQNAIALDIYNNQNALNPYTL